MKDTQYCLFKDIYVKQPTLKEIIDFAPQNGYKAYSEIVTTFTMTPADIADILWVEQEILYTTIKSDWEFFIQRAYMGALDFVITEIVNGEEIKTETKIANPIIEKGLNYFFNLTGHYCFTVETKTLVNEPAPAEEAEGEKDASKPNQHREIILLNVDENGLAEEDGFKFTESLYVMLAQYLRAINWEKDVPFFMQELQSKNDSPVHLKNKKLLKALLEAAYQKRNNKRRPKFNLESMVSALICYTGDYKNIWDYPIYMIYDLYHRINKFKSYDETMSIVHSGYYDIKKNPIKWDEINWASIIAL